MMSDLHLLLLVAYVSGVIICWVGAALLRMDGDAKPRTIARLALAAPVWPVAVAWLAIRHVPRFIGKLFTTAFGSERSE